MRKIRVMKKPSLELDERTQICFRNLFAAERYSSKDGVDRVYDMFEKAQETCERFMRDPNYRPQYY